MFEPLLGIEAVRRFASRELIDVPAFERICRAVEGLPDAMYCASFECRLDGSDRRVDFLSCIRADDGGRKRLAPYFERLLRSSDNPGHLALAAFSLEWVDTDSLLCASVPFIWLEMDVPVDVSAPIGAPLLFFCVQPTFLSDPWYRIGPRGPIGALKKQWDVITKGLSVLLGGNAPPALISRLFSCLASLPVGGTVLHLAPLANRGSTEVRVVLSVPTAAVASLLRDIGWPGSFLALTNALQLCTGQGTNVGVQLNVGERVAPALGLQVYLPPEQGRWAAFLATMECIGLCAHEKAVGLLSWLGQSDLTLPGRQWPERLRRELEVKLQLLPDGMLQAKAYLGFGLDFTL